MIITEALCEGFAHFLLTVPARRFRQNMLTVFFSYLQQQGREGWPDFMNSFLPDLMAFFDLLDAIETETDQPGTNQAHPARNEPNSPQTPNFS